MIHEYFPPEVIFLQDELLHHLPLMEILSKLKTDDIGERLAAICTYCGIVVDDTFSSRELIDLCTQMTKNLYSLRTSIVLPH